MAEKIYRIALSEKDRKGLEKLVSIGKRSAREINRARALLLADENVSGKTDDEIGIILGLHEMTIHNIRKRYFKNGLTAVMEGARSGKPRKLTGKQEALIIATACTKAPEGYEKWSVRLLADKLVEMNVTEEISKNTVWRVLKKMNSSRTCRSNGA